MDNQPQQSSGILFYNKFYQKRPPSKALCLNPNCKANRLCESSSRQENESIRNRDHHTCNGWIHSLSTLKQWSHDQESLKLKSDVSTDYFEKPIESIFYMEKYRCFRWEDQLFNHFQQLKGSIDEELGKIYIKCQRDINFHLQANRQIFEKIQTFCESPFLSWNQNHEQFYKQNLEDGLRQIQKIGLLKISNKQMLSKSLSLILDQLKTIEFCIWNKEMDYDLLERAALKAQREQLNNFNLESSPQQINNKVNMISASLKSAIKYIEEERVLKTICLACPKTFHSTASNTKLRRHQCRSALLKHMLSCHIDQIASKQSIGSPLKLNLQEFKRQIIAKDTKKVIVVDKENISAFNSETMFCFPDYYCIEVVSKNSEQIAKGKYLLAESKGKDAADIFTIIILWELSKLKLEQIILLTKDHYGQTLQPIFASLGIKITISDSTQLSSLVTRDLTASRQQISID